MVLSLKAIYRLGIILALRFIQLPFWSIYYSWRPNRPRRSWTRRRAVNVRMFKRFHQVGIELGLRDGRDLSVEVPQEELEPLNARFVWIPELDEGDIVGVVAKHAAMMDVKSISIPAYWMFKEGVRWSPAHEKVQKDETVMLYFHGGAFVVRFLFSSCPVLVRILILVLGWDRSSISSHGGFRQGVAQTFHISLQSIVGRLPAQFCASSLRAQKPISGRGNRRHRGLQVPCL